jgi:uncharacterized membrane protein YdjX (TVP38/TMEM64 family)
MSNVPRTPARRIFRPSTPALFGAGLIAAALFALVFVVLANQGGHLMELLVEQEDRLRSWQRHFPWSVFATAFAAYFAACFLPGTNGKALLSGWLFGILAGTVLINAAAMMAAFLMFYVARYALRGHVETHYAGRLEGIRNSIQRDGGAYLFALRLVPVVPYAVLNALMGVSPMRARTFWWSTQLGMLPANFVFAWAGASLPGLRDLQEKQWSELIHWQFFAALLLMGLLAVAARRILRVGRPAAWMRKM